MKGHFIIAFCQRCGRIPDQRFFMTTLPKLNGTMDLQDLIVDAIEICPHCNISLTFVEFAVAEYHTNITRRKRNNKK